jgi:F-type H+-transporting ATPase subunit epsilon
VARSSFPVEVLTPEGKLFEDEVEMVSTRSDTGGLGILANHAPLMAMLEPTELRLYKSDSDVVSYAQGEGYLQVIDNSALLILEDAHAPEDLDRSELESQLKDAEKARDEAEEGTEEHQRCVREVRRLNTFLEIGQGGSS